MDECYRASGSPVSEAREDSAPESSVLLGPYPPHSTGRCREEGREKEGGEGGGKEG